MWVLPAGDRHHVATGLFLQIGLKHVGPNLKCYCMEKKLLVSLALNDTVLKMETNAISSLWLKTYHGLIFADFRMFCWT